MIGGENMDAIRYVEAPSTFNGRYTTALCKRFKQLNCEIYVGKDNRLADGKSLIGMLSLGVKAGDSVKLLAVGNAADCEKAAAIFSEF